jgi:hypothetical protein
MRRWIALGGMALAWAWLLGCGTQTFDHSDAGVEASVPDDGAGYADGGADSTLPVGDATPPPGDAGTEAATDAQAPADASGDATPVGDATLLPGDAGTEAATDAQAPADASGDATMDAAADATSAVVDAGADSAEEEAAADGGDAGPCAGYVFCDGFEQGFDNWSSELLIGGTLTIDSTHVYRGSYALHSHIDPIVDAGGYSSALVQRYQTWPTHLFARFFAYQPSPRAPSPVNYADIGGLNSPYPGIALSTDPPDGDLSMNTFSTGEDQTWESDGGVMPMDQWVCFELDLDTLSETSLLYVNDVEVTDMSRGLLDLPQLGILGVGLTFNLPNVQPAQDAWIDEVAVSTSRIGCTDSD